MKIYYIDDSFFAKTDIAHAMRYKLKVILEEQVIDCLLISSTGKYDKEIDCFRKDFPDIVMHVNGTYQLQSLPIQVNPCSATIDNSMMYALSQSYCIFDTDMNIFRRFYLNFFVQEETSIISLIQEQIENILFQKDDNLLNSKH